MGNSIASCLRGVSRLIVAAVRMCSPLRRLVSVISRVFPVHGLIDMRPTAESRASLLAIVEAVHSAARRPVTIVEIGSYRGESAEAMLSTGLVGKLYCVDPWIGGYDDLDGASYSDMREAERDFDRRHASDPRVVKVKGTVDDFVRLYGHVDVDAVYVDGCHTYEAVSHDIAVCVERIEPKYAVAGHDFNPYFGARRAVMELLGQPDVVYPDTSWVMFIRAGECAVV